MIGLELAIPFAGLFRLCSSHFASRGLLARVPMDIESRSANYGFGAGVGQGRVSLLQLRGWGGGV